jgi:D-alanyl-D-alanine carboxypeptidase (penicillin-binding protein 5/6)
VLLDAGETQTVDVLLKSMIVGSANDATVAMAEHISGSVELFVDLMNRRAAELGMNDTHFVNATGLPAQEHYTTARDVARMAMELIGHKIYFEYSTIWLDEVVHESGRKTSLTNTNRLIRLYDGCDGVKTGSTNEAGYCMAATAKRGDMRLIAVVLGADTGKERFHIASEMMDYGFANYRRYPVTQKGTKVRGALKVAGGSEAQVELMLNEDLTLLLLRGEEQKIALVANLPEYINAPVEKGMYVGSVDVMLGNRVVAQVSVSAAHSVPRQSFFDGLRRVLAHWRI